VTTRQTGSSKGSVSPPRPKTDWRIHAYRAAIALAVVAAYWRTFAVPPLFDDDASIADNPTIHRLATALSPPSYATVGGRPVLNLSLAINYAISGNQVWSYHVLNLAIHVCAALVLFGIVRRTLVIRAVVGAPDLALCVALIWALHPLQTESVTYLVQRAESLMGLFYLATLYFFIRGATRAAAGFSPWFVLSIAACLFGMATKEVMVSAPLIVLLYDRTFLAGGFDSAWRRRKGVYIGLAATWIILPFLVISTHGRGGTAGFGSGVSVGSYALTEFRAIVHYLRLSVWPHPLVFDYGTALAAATIGVLADAFVIAVLLAATVWALVKRPTLGFLGFCFFAILAPSSSFVPVASEPMAEHRMYLALIPIVILAVFALHRWARRGALAICASLAASLLAATVVRNAAYASDEQIWRDTVAKLPDNERAHNNLGTALDDEGRTGEAIEQFQKVLQLKPDLAEAHGNLGNALSKLPGRTAEAIAQFRESLRLKPDFVRAHINLANALEDEGQVGEAIEQDKEALRLRPDSAQAHSNLGSALAKVPGRLSEAIDECEEAIRLKPDLAEAHSNLGSALGMVPGRLDEAIAQGEEAIRLKPGDAKAHNNLGNILVKSPGHLDDAIAQFETAIRLRPSMSEAHNNLGNALNAKGRTDEAIAQFEEALRLRPDSPEAHSNLGNVLARAPGRLNEAVAQYREALRLKPDYVSAHNNLGSVLNAEGQTSEAVTEFEAAVRLNPDIPSIHLNLAMALLKLQGRTDEAMAHLQTVLRLQPDNAIARQVLDRIGSGQP
jgi:protein O-mannosyl-transferase